jgi:iron complex transport system permease protein
VVLLFSDVIGRLLGSPGELEAGIVTAFLGAPVLIFVAARSKVREL